MQLDLTRYRRPLDHFERTFQPTELGAEQEAYHVASPVALAFDIHKDKDKFRLVGTVHADLDLSCSRCLERYRFPVSGSFDLRYLPASAAAAAAEVEVEDEDLETSYYRDDVIDLNDLMREQFYLVLPMKPLCSDNCEGLCPQCGTNLNISTCDCAPPSEDPRLAALKALRRTQ